MADCEEQVYSNDYFDFIIPYGEAATIPVAQACTQRIDEDFDIFYYSRQGLPPLSVGAYTYNVIPKCFGVLDQTALEVSGIIRMQNQPALALKGEGVLVGFIDTGIDYTNPVFRYSDGSTRIVSLWDQSERTGTPPAGIIYGSEYRKNVIDEALENADPYSVVPSQDEIGHGSFVAGVACGSEDITHDFIGAVPNAAIAVVKLKEAKQYLRDFFFIPEGIPVYQENDIMMGVSYLNALANELNMPLVICFALGNTMGSHGDDGPLPIYLNYICTRRKRSIAVAAGNEANSRHHFQGRITADMEYEDVEISVEENRNGFYVELWAKAPELYEVSVISPTGETVPRVPVRIGASEQYNFVFEQTTVTIDYRIEAKETASQLIFFRFLRPKRGVWTIRVYPRNTVEGVYNMWLPRRAMTEGTVFFLQSNPDITITTPGNARQVITVGGYNAANDSIFVDSGRGYALSGAIKPDFVAPAVNVYGPGKRNTFVTYTGTSAAAAIASGAVAQVLQWAIVEQNNATISNAAIKNMLIRGTRKPAERSYPNREWGYGALDVYNAFVVLRE